MKKTPLKRKPYTWKVKSDPLIKLWSQYIRMRAGFKCELCGQSGKVLHAHHFIGRKKLQTRYLVDNGICLCFVCHQEVHNFSSLNQEVFIKRVGSERVEELEILARITGRKLDKEAIKKSLLEKIRRVSDES